MIPELRLELSKSKFLSFAGFGDGLVAEAFSRQSRTERWFDWTASAGDLDAREHLGRIEVTMVLRIFLHLDLGRRRQEVVHSSVS